MGVSKFVSFGNKCDVTDNEITYYMLQRQRNHVILSYVEDIKHGREFLKVAKKSNHQKARYRD
jgi:acetyltransferase